MSAVIYWQNPCKLPMWFRCIKTWMLAIKSRIVFSKCFTAKKITARLTRVPRGFYEWCKIDWLMFSKQPTHYSYSPLSFLNLFLFWSYWRWIQTVFHVVIQMLSRLGLDLLPVRGCLSISSRLFASQPGPRLSKRKSKYFHLPRTHPGDTWYRAVLGFFLSAGLRDLFAGEVVLGHKGTWST